MKATLLAGIFACCCFAQPPDLIRVVRQGSIQPYVNGKIPVDVIGMSAISGPGETWLIELHSTFASIEDLDKAVSVYYTGITAANASLLGDEVLPSSRTWIARFRPGLSYRPEQAMQNLPKARYLDVLIYRIPPGAQTDFEKVQKLREFSKDTVNSDRADITYEVISGASSGTYISLTPFISLRTLDEGRAAVPVYAQGAASEFSGTVPVQRERFWFRLEPQQSHVSDRFASADPDFWHP